MPTRLQGMVRNISFDSNNFTHLPPQISIIAHATENTDPIPEILQELEEKFDIKEKPSEINIHK